MNQIPCSQIYARRAPPWMISVNSGKYPDGYFWKHHLVNRVKRLPSFGLVKELKFDSKFLVNNFSIALKNKI